MHGNQVRCYNVRHDVTVYGAYVMPLPLYDVYIIANCLLPHLTTSHLPPYLSNVPITDVRFSRGWRSGGIVQITDIYFRRALWSDGIFQILDVCFRRGWRPDGAADGCQLFDPHRGAGLHRLQHILQVPGADTEVTNGSEWSGSTASNIA